MIGFSTAKEAITLAQTYNAKGVVFTTQASSPLNSLVSKLLGSASIARDEEIICPEYISALSDNFGAQNRGEATSYDMELEATAKTIAAHVRSHMSYARNVITPVIAEYVKTLTEHVQNLSCNPEKDFKVNINRVPAPLKATSLREHLSSYADSNVRPNLSLPGDDRTEEELRASIIESIPGLEEELGSWVSSKPTGYFKAIWDERFSKKGTRNKYDRDIDYLLSVYVIAGRVQDTPGAESGMSLAQWQRDASEMHIEAGQQLTRLMARIDDQIKLGVLITAWETGSVSVNELVYNDWIEKGGSVTLLMAATLQSRVPTIVADIEADVQKLNQDWTRYLALQNSIFTSRKFSLMKEAAVYHLPMVVKGFAKQIYAPFGGDETNFEKLSVHQNFHKLLTEKSAHIRAADFEDLWKFARMLVCDTVFHFTDGGDLLRYREEAFKTNPDISSDDAEFLSRIEYVIDYVFDQLSVSNRR